MVSPAIVILGPSALDTARRVRAALGGAEIHGPARMPADTAFEHAPSHIAALFAEGRPIVGVCAAGILVRALAGALGDKRAEPPVIAVAEDGSAVVPLLGGHRGANDLARRIAKALAVTPAITTAGDLRFGIALDEPPEGWTLANPEDAKGAMAALLAGASARLEGEAPWIAESGLALSQDGSVTLLASERTEAGGANRLVYHPRTLALGAGCERGCDPEELIGLVDSAMADAGLAPQAVALVASLDLKTDEPAIHALAAHLGVPARFFAAEVLNAEAHRLANPSEMVMREVGCPGVAEGAALAATGPAGALIVEKSKSRRATCAIARAPAPIRAGAVGRPRGRLAVVGLGPGGADWCSPEARRHLQQATDWVGYGLYLDLAAELIARRTEHRFDLGEEEARVRHALALAGDGRDVALICSGDAGIYAMAALVFEVVDSLDAGDPARRAEIAVVPGISAFQAAAARAGALIGHDFCSISLSDLLTPWDVIAARLEAAAQGDFVVALYNPRSAGRPDHLAKAVTLLRRHRPPDTPVVVAGNLGRARESLIVTDLDRFAPDTVDMLSVVLVGASMSRALTLGDGRVYAYTPRGYAAKRRAAE